MRPRRPNSPDAHRESLLTAWSPRLADLLSTRPPGLDTPRSLDMRPLRRVAAVTVQLLLLQLLLLGGRGACQGATQPGPATGGVVAPVSTGCEHASPAPVQTAPVHTAPVHHHAPPKAPHAPCHDGTNAPAHCVTMATCAAALVSMTTAVSVLPTRVISTDAPARHNQRAPVTWRGAPEPPPPRA